MHSMEKPKFLANSATGKTEILGEFRYVEKPKFLANSATGKTEIG